MKASNGEAIGLQIMGAITDHQSPEKNVALIKETAEQRVRAVKTGYSVLKTFRVTKVTPKYITIENSETKESQIIYQNKFSADFSTPKEPTKPQFNSPYLASRYSYKEKGLERIDKKTRISAELRAKLLTENLSEILMQASAIPELKNGMILGFKLLQIETGSLYDKVGLKDGDVITEINNTALQSAGQAISLLRSLKEAQSMQLSVLRDEQTLQFEIEVP